MKRYKRDWEGDTTLNFRTFWLRCVLRQIAHALFVLRTFGVPCSKFFTLTLFTVKLVGRYKCWPSPIIAVSQAIGWLGFNWVIDPTFASHCKR